MVKPKHIINEAWLLEQKNTSSHANSIYVTVGILCTIQHDLGPAPRHTRTAEAAVAGRSIQDEENQKTVLIAISKKLLSSILLYKYKLYLYISC